jgi:hypothetical protein
LRQACPSFAPLGLGRPIEFKMESHVKPRFRPASVADPAQERSGCRYANCGALDTVVDQWLSRHRKALTSPCLGGQSPCTLKAGSGGSDGHK